MYHEPSKRTQFLILFLEKTDAFEVIEYLGIEKTFSSFFGANACSQPLCKVVEVGRKAQWGLIIRR